MTETIAEVVDSTAASPSQLHRLPAEPASAPSAPCMGEIIDRGSYVPLEEAGGGVETGTATIGGTPTVVYATVPTQRGGALGVDGCRRIVRAIEHAQNATLPVLAVWHSAGADLREGVPALRAVAEVFAAITRASGRVMQVAVVDGPAAGGASYGAALNDVVMMTDAGRMFVTGPVVVEKVMGAKVSMEDLGGARVHARSSGVCHLHTPTRQDARDALACLLRLVTRPSSTPPRSTVSDPGRHVPDSPKQVYDISLVVDEIVDDRIELHPSWSANVLTELAVVEGRRVGVLANNPRHRAGCLDAQGGDKAARFVRLCDALGIPILVLVDVPGYMPGIEEESSGVLRRGAKLLHAFADVAVPTMTVIVRKAFGGAYIAMNSVGLSGSHVVAWPRADVGIMAPESSVEILHARELNKLPAAAASLRRGELLQRYKADMPSIEGLVELEVVDEVIEPARTREHVSEWLASAPASRGLIRNIPL